MLPPKFRPGRCMSAPCQQLGPLGRLQVKGSKIRQPADAEWYSIRTVTPRGRNCFSRGPLECINLSLWHPEESVYCPPLNSSTHVKQQKKKNRRKENRADNSPEDQLDSVIFGRARPKTCPHTHTALEEEYRGLRSLLHLGRTRSAPVTSSDRLSSALSTDRPKTTLDTRERIQDRAHPHESSPTPAQNVPEIKGDLAPPRFANAFPYPSPRSEPDTEICDSEIDPDMMDSRDFLLLPLESSYQSMAFMSGLRAAPVSPDSTAGESEALDVRC